MTTRREERWGLLGRSWACACGATHEVPVRAAVVEPGALRRIPSVIQELALSGPAFFLADENTQHAAGERVCGILAGAGIAVHPVVLPGRPRSEASFADAVAARVPGDARLVVSCGSGTITDLGKWAAHRRGLPQIAVATAPSMNGYASGIAALVRDGLKATTPVTPAVAVVADVDVLAAAPAEMIRAGLGDLVSKPCCNADWRLATILRGGRFCRKPFELVRDLEEISLGRAHLLSSRDPATIAALAEALIFSGVSMLMAGSSEPASGGEHLICHVLDMWALAEGRLPDFHGAQVGIGTVAMAELYELLMATRGEALDARALASVWERGEAMVDRCRGAFGGAADAVVAAFNAKRGSKAALAALSERIRERWEVMMDAAGGFVRPASEGRAVLRAAGAKAHFSELGIGAERFRDAAALAMCVRNRYTSLDLAFAAGLSEIWTASAARAATESPS
jgi:glycerol-1-phosphate dehydrogenase [NAD(P)+]